MQRFKHLVLSTFLLAQIAATGTAQTIDPLLETMFQRTLDSMIVVLNSKGLGASVQISTDAVWAGAAGISSANPLEELTTDHVFGIGSVHKTMTAGCILQMADEGKLSIEDSLHEWLDTFPFINPNITIRQLLRHQSGIYDVITNPDYQPTILTDLDSIWKWDDVIRTFIHAPLFQPGASFSYSNTNYLLLGLIIEKVGGRPYHEELRDRFLKPLNLNSIVLPPYEAFPPDVAHLWLDLNGDGTVDDAHDFFSSWKSWHSSAAPAGSYFSTPADMARWMRAYMNGSLLSPAMMTAMKTSVTTPFPNGTKYGLGIMDRNIFGLKAYGHGGDAGFSASVWYFPSKDISIAVLNNDGRRTSWSLIPTVTALLRTYLKYETLTSANEEVSSEALQLTAFPNPFLEGLSITTNLPESVSSTRFVLSNALGERVAETETGYVSDGLQQFKLEDLAGLPSGLYFLTSYLDGQLVTSRKIMHQTGG